MLLNFEECVLRLSVVFPFFSFVATSSNVEKDSRRIPYSLYLDTLKERTVPLLLLEQKA